MDSLSGCSAFSFLFPFFRNHSAAGRPRFSDISVLYGNGMKKANGCPRSITSFYMDIFAKVKQNKAKELMVVVNGAFGQ